MPLTMPMRAQTSCTAIISGSVSTAVHNVAYPNDAPATAYVAIPLGSSSDAPVTRPGPSFFRNARLGTAAIVPLSALLSRRGTTPAGPICVGGMEAVMWNRDEIEGKADQLKGRVKQAAGDLNKNERLRNEGEAQEAAGQGRESVARGRRKVGEAIEK